MVCGFGDRLDEIARFCGLEIDMEALDERCSTVATYDIERGCVAPRFEKEKSTTVYAALSASGT